MLQRSLTRQLTSLLSILSVFILYSVQKATRFPAHHPQGPQGELGDQPVENNNHNDLPPKASKERQYDAVIIGAGWAGLRAAKTLLDAGISNIVVLEANDYIGGRSKTVNQDGSINSPSTSVDNVPIEVGSEWLFTNNDMEKYLREHDYLARAPIIDERAFFVPLLGEKFYEQTRHNNGTIQTKVFNDSDKYKDRVWGGFQSFRKYRLKKRGKDDAESWGEALDAYRKTAKLSSKEMQYLHLLEKIFMVEYAGQSDRVSLGERDLFDGVIPQSRYMGTRGLGFGNVASRFGQAFSSKIRLNSRVTRIDDYRDGGKTSVAFVRSGEVTRVAARTVLITASLGVLKAGGIEFRPRLPRWKQEVIDSMGFGVMNKCSMHWDDDDGMVWPEGDFWFELMAPGRWTSFYNPSSFKETPALVGWVGGDDAAAMEEQTDQEIINEVTKNLEAMFPTVRRPDRVVITRWGGEENVRGTYSFKAAGRDFDRDSELLGREIGGLWFAGEATAGSGWHGCTVGGWNTGDDAARSMIRALAPNGLRGGRKATR